MRELLKSRQKQRRDTVDTNLDEIKAHQAEVMKNAQVPELPLQHVQKIYERSVAMVSDHTTLEIPVVTNVASEPMQHTIWQDIVLFLVRAI